MYSPTLYRCIKCGCYRVYKINNFYFECQIYTCRQAHELSDFGSTVKVYPPITFLTQEQEDERIERD